MKKFSRSFPDVDRDRLQLLYPSFTRTKHATDVAAIDRERILKAADAALALPPLTITKFHAKFSEGGPNDFYSNGDYWWPDPTKTNGLPYIQRDGETNPDNFNQHRLAIRQLRDAVAALGAAYKITGDDRYAAQGGGVAARVFSRPGDADESAFEICAGDPGRFARPRHRHH